MIFRILLIFVLLLFVLQALYSGYFLLRSKSLKTDSFADELELGDKNDPALSLFISGDSVAEGVGATSFMTSVAGRVAEYYAQDHYVSFQNHAISGVTVGEMQAMVKPEKKQDVMVLIVSSNDLFRFTSYDDFEHDIDVLLEQYAPFGKKVIIVGPGRVFDGEALPFFMQYIYKKRAPRYASILQKSIAKYPHVEYVNPSDKYFDNKLTGAETAADRFHPNDSGHDWWFNTFKSEL